MYPLCMAKVNILVHQTQNRWWCSGSVYVEKSFDSLKYHRANLNLVRQSAWCSPEDCFSPAFISARYLRIYRDGRNRRMLVTGVKTVAMNFKLDCFE